MTADILNRGFTQISADSFFTTDYTDYFNDFTICLSGNARTDFMSSLSAAKPRLRSLSQKMKSPRLCVSAFNLQLFTTVSHPTA